MEPREDFEPDPNFPPFFGDGGWAPVEGPVLANEEDADEFDPKHADDITGLLYLGYLTHTFDLYGHSFTIRTLRRGERLDALSLAKEFEDTLGMADAVQTALVAASIMLVDGHPLTAALSEKEPAIVRIKGNYDKVSDYFDPVIEGIYNEYARLTLRQAAAFEALLGKSKASRLSP